VQEKSDEGILCKTPLGYKDDEQLDGLITLKNFVDGGHEVAAGKVLVCVKSIGGRKKCRHTFSGSQREVANIQKSQQRREIPQKRWIQISLMIRSKLHLHYGATLLHLPACGKLRIPYFCFPILASRVIEDLHYRLVLRLTSTLTHT